MIKLSKTQICKIIQCGGFLGSLLSKIAGSLMKVAVPLVKKYFRSIANNSCCFSNWCRNSKKIHSSRTATVIFSNEKMYDILKILQALEDSNVLLKGITKTTEIETREQNRGFLGKLLGTLEASLLENMLTEKRILRAGYGNKEGKGMLRTGYGSKDLFLKTLIPSHPLTNFRMQKYYQNEPRFNGVYSSDTLPKRIKDWEYVINVDEYADVGTH